MAAVHRQGFALKTSNKAQAATVLTTPMTSVAGLPRTVENQWRSASVPVLAAARAAAAKVTTAAPAV